MVSAWEHTSAGLPLKRCYRWKSKYGGLELSEAWRLKQLEEENRQLKHIVAEQAVDIRALKAVLRPRSHTFLQETSGCPLFYTRCR
jgi:hypothetical protein